MILRCGFFVDLRWPERSHFSGLHTKWTHAQLSKSIGSRTFPMSNFLFYFDWDVLILPRFFFFSFSFPIILNFFENIHRTNRSSKKKKKKEGKVSFFFTFTLIVTLTWINLIKICDWPCTINIKNNLRSTIIYVTKYKSKVILTKNNALNTVVFTLRSLKSS